MPKNSLFYSAVIVFLLSYYILLLVYWVSINASGGPDRLDNYIFVLLITLVPLTGFLTGLRVSEDWGYLKSSLGISVLFGSMGVLSWGIGNIMFAYFNMITGTIPYPSIADFFYLLVYLFYIIGIYFLFKAFGIKKMISNISQKYLLFFIPVSVFLVTYLIESKNSLDRVVVFNSKFILDIAYPFLDAVLLTVALNCILVLRNVKIKGIKLPLFFIVLGLLLEYFADMGFAESINLNSFYPANWVDLVFLTSITCISIALPLLSKNRIKVLSK